MDSPLKKYKQLQNIDGIRELAYDTLFTKYIELNLKADKKLWEIDSTDQESIMLRKNGGFPLPGFVYTFIYPPQEGDSVKILTPGKEKEYTDFVPIVFCLSVKGKTFKGINLNTLPNIERVKFLEAYWRSYKSFFENIEEKTENNKLALNKKFISIMSLPIAAKVIDLMSKVSNANFKYGYRSYNVQRIKQLRMVEYTEWDYIPFYDPKNAFKGMNQKQIHDLYWRTR
jgi:hypothetical protein